jgi:hypothetical protein
VTVRERTEERERVTVRERTEERKREETMFLEDGGGYHQGQVPHRTAHTTDNFIIQIQQNFKAVKTYYNM